MLYWLIPIIVVCVGKLCVCFFCYTGQIVDFCFSRSHALEVPRVLSCLHVFCEACLDKKLIGEGGDSATPDTAIVCPSCSQETKVSFFFLM